MTMDYENEFQKIVLLTDELRHTARALINCENSFMRNKYRDLKHSIEVALDRIPDGGGIPDWYYKEKGWEIPK